MKKGLPLTNEKYKAPLTELYRLQTFCHESGCNFKKFSEYFGLFSIEDFPLINFHISVTLLMMKEFLMIIEKFIEKKNDGVYNENKPRSRRRLRSLYLD
jgi:hypothetical protein